MTSGRLSVSFNRLQRLSLIALTSLLLSFGMQVIGRAQGYHTNHETVLDMIEKGVAYLEAGSPGGRSDFLSANGGPMLAAMCIVKHRGETNHPKVEEGIRMALEVVRDTQRKTSTFSGERQIYEASVAVMLLCSISPEAYQDELETLKSFFLQVQRPYGAYGYLHGPRAETGDTSQTQYAMLALWTLDQNKHYVDAEVVERLIRFMQNTQDPSGGWGYQGKIARPGALEKQVELGHSMAAAGFSALLIGGDFLNFFRNRGADAEEEDVPKAFHRVIENGDQGAKKVITMRRDDIDDTIKLAESYHVKNPFSRDENQRTWYYYYMYSQERMYAFLEIAKNKIEKSPKWYNDGVTALRKYQNPTTGGWDSKNMSLCSDEVSTAFAVLYLMRSTQKAIGAAKEGVMEGGQGNLEDVANAMEVNGKIATKKVVDPIEEAMGEIEKSAEKLDDVVASDRVKLKDDPKQRKDQLNRFARVLRNSPPEARLAAAKLLGRGDDLDYVPDLIYGLTDPLDPVARAAETSLQILSRKMTVRYLPNLPADQKLSVAQKNTAVERWREWYLTVRPDYLFINAE